MLGRRYCEGLFSTAIWISISGVVWTVGVCHNFWTGPDEGRGHKLQLSPRP
jgi:hypothetical protein